MRSFHKSSYAQEKLLLAPIGFGLLVRGPLLGTKQLHSARLMEKGLGYLYNINPRDIPPLWENPMEKKSENEMKMFF